ncbi:HAD-IC family P-type ATPase [Candidatus Uhrbacteria bacterium]|nr:HAD-IC family P-type ATPase [Candidatus Uhrbacteria bacterium]
MNTQSWHTLSSKEVLLKLETTVKGLTISEVAIRAERYGKNRLPSRKSDPGWKVFLRQFMSPMILVLIVAAGVSFIFGDLVDVGVISVAVLLNTFIGFGQEYKASKALEELQSLVQPVSVVLREGRELSISAEDVLPGDILELRTGDSVTADARIIESVDLMTNESALTGESLPLHKTDLVLQEQVSIAERVNMVFAGTSIVGGRGKAVVVATGLQTELGAIANLVQSTQESRTPLQEQLGRLATWLAWIVVGLVVILFVLGIVTGREVKEMLELSVALAVAAIPEGLVISVTVILAIGMQRVLHRKALIRRLVAAETLGSVSVICSDKTGTITQGEMRVTHLITSKETWTYPFSFEADLQTSERTLFEVMALCNDAIFVEDDQDPLRGSPTERALLSAVLEQNLDPADLAKTLPRIWEIPFNSADKFMVTAHASMKKMKVFLKGAPDIVLPFCSSRLINGKKSVLTQEQRTQLNEQILTFSRRGIRLIAIGVRSMEVTQKPLSREELDQFTFVGFVGLRDPLRPEAREQIKAAYNAGIRTVIVTGDHPETARAIGVEAGLIVGDDSVVIGTELDAWSDEELARRVPAISIYARVEPRHKIRIVHAWQSRGEVVAMTGDGVNDAPALKSADMGVAVGSGTEVAKQSADMVILDNNLGTITAAIEEGRVMFDNVRKTTVYLISGSFTELILVGGSLLFGLPLPLLAIQILWINLVTDTFPAIGLTIEPAEKGIMQQPPRSRTEPILDSKMIQLIFIIAGVTNVLLFGLYVWLLNTEESIEIIRSIMFIAVGIDTLIFAFAVKSFRRTIFRLNPFSNPWLIVGVILGFGILIIPTIHPFIQEIFELTPISLSVWGLLLMIGVVKLIAIEITKELFLFRKT